MNLSPRDIMNQLRDFWQRQTKRVKIIIISGAAAILAIAVLAAVLLNSNGYVVLYEGLSNEESPEIVSRLNGMGVDFKMESGGTILVPKEEEAQLKMQLASEGYPQSTLNYDIFTNNAGLMTTDYDKKKYLLFQLQNRLQDAIKTLDGVKNAIVTISMADESSFVLDKDKMPSTASVVLELSGNTELSKKQIKGITELVAKSVPGLETKNVAIVDGEGNILSVSTEETTSGLADTRLDVVNGVNETFKNKIISLLEPVFGRNGISVAVNVVMDFDKKIKEVTTYSPANNDTGIISKQDSTKETVNNGANTATGTAGTGANTGTTEYAQGSQGGGSSASESVSTEYLVNKIVESIQSDGGDVKDMTVAVMINSKQLSQESLEKYRELVAYGVGVDVSKVAFTYAEFGGVPAVNPETPSPVPLNLPLLAGAGAAAVLLLVLGILLIRSGRRRKQKQEEEEPEIHEEELLPEEEVEVPEQPPELNIQINDSMPDDDMPKEIVLNETREQVYKRQIRDFSSNNPEIVAQLIRTWLREEDNE